jgi:N-methylhydantoinase A
VIPAHQGDGGHAAPHLRIGIDVGGTFTDVVAMDGETGALVAQVKVPTTHRASEGVARGIVDGLGLLLEQLRVDPGSVGFIAHSTTQATNALLEGDVARVGIVGAGRFGERWKARIDTRVPAIAIAEDKHLRPEHAFAAIADPESAAEAVRRAVESLQQRGVEVVVASEAFGVDDPRVELAIAEAARARGLWATAGHEVSSLYGLRTRTRTAAINGAILPRMVATARMTARAVVQAGIAAPLMIMRSDGGVMTVEEVERRPIQTMLSGPAAGVAGALMHERVSDGIFIEVGGTSADISVIRDGQPQTRPARVGGHRTFLNTLDVRTLAIAGGSMVRVRDNRLHDVGPRSAHIAGVGYACFAPPGTFDREVEVGFVAPLPGDPGDYLVLGTPAGRYALTPTCAANAAGLVPAGAFAHGDAGTARAAIAIAAGALHIEATTLAADIMDRACGKVVAQIEALVGEYGLARGAIDLVGGGGGAAALVPHSGAMLGVPWRLAKHAEVISPIGVALALVRDTVERTIVDPTPADVLQVRQQAIEAVVRNGAVADTVEVVVDVDPRKNRVRATAVGSAELRRSEHGPRAAEPAERLAAAARSFRRPVDEVAMVASTGSLDVFAATMTPAPWWQRWRRVRTPLRVMDRAGVVRLQRDDAGAHVCTTETLESTLRGLLAAVVDYGDAGRTLPDLHVLLGSRVLNLAGLADEGQVLGLAGVEARACSPGQPLVILVGPRV